MEKAMETPAECRAEESPGILTPRWYENAPLKEMESFIRASLKDAARSVIAVGYYLKNIRDRELFREEGYETIWDYAADRYGFSKSTASRYMSRNDRFSAGGHSPIMAAEFREYSKAQMQEMLSLDAEQLGQVSPDMTVREIRELKRPPAKDIPYFEIPGQLCIEDLLGGGPEEVSGAETGGREAGTEVPGAPGAAAGLEPPENLGSPESPPRAWEISAADMVQAAREPRGLEKAGIAPESRPRPSVATSQQEETEGRCVFAAGSAGLPDKTQQGAPEPFVFRLDLGKLEKILSEKEEELAKCLHIADGDPAVLELIYPDWVVVEALKRLVSELEYEAKAAGY